MKKQGRREGQEEERKEEQDDHEDPIPVFQSVNVFFLAFPGILSGDLVSDLAPDAFQLSLLLLGQRVVRRQLDPFLFQKALLLICKRKGEVCQQEVSLDLFKTS